MGFIFSFIKLLIKSTLLISLFVAAIVLIPNLPPYSKFSNIILEPTQAREGSLAPNNALNEFQKLYDSKVNGPEALQVFDGEIYTGLASGEIVKLSPGGHVTFVTKIGEPCHINSYNEEKCGRPLGFKINENDKTMVVADAYHGIWKVDLKNDKKQLLVSPRVEIEGKAPKFFNDVALDKNGDFFWTDSCDYLIKDGVFCMLTDPSGRLFHYNAAKNTSKVLVDNLWFANGVGVSPDRQFVVVAETAACRLVKHYIDGPKKGKTETFVAGLPGLPDNIQVLPDGSGLLVALYTAFDNENPLLTKSMANTPIIRKFLARFLRLIEIPFEFLNSQFPHVVFQAVPYYIGNFKTSASFLPPIKGLVHLDWNGNIVASYYNTNGGINSISDAVVLNGKLYTGSPHLQDFVAAFPAPEALIKAFSSKPKKQTVKSEPRAEPVVAKKEEKLNQNPKVEKPKPQEAPSTTVKPQVQQKATPQAKPQVQQKSKPQTEEAQTQQQAKPQAQQQAKPQTEKQAQGKPTPKPTEKKPEPKTTQQAAKPTTPPPKPTTTPPKPTTTPPKPTTTPPKPTTTPPRPAESKPKSVPKPAEPKEDKTKKDTKPEKKVQPKEVPEAIPVEEVIVTDTAKPTKAPLKVIKREGPAEIPNNL